MGGEAVVDFIRGIHFTGLNYAQVGEDKSKESLRLMKERTNCNTVILVIGALQDTAFSDSIDYKHCFMPKDEELEDFIGYAKKMGLKVVLKPVINCKDGTWRALINFFDLDVTCEPKWSVWFSNYYEYQLYYAALAQHCGCEMLIAGCELVMSERREAEWRELFQRIRKVYTGLLCYNTDKYQEGQVPFWDAVDVIGTSGYYPMEGFGEQLERLEAISTKYGKPFYFAECGCKSCEGASKNPNIWMLQGAVNLEEQAQYFSELFEKCRDRNFIQGFGIWDWHSRLIKEERSKCDNGFSIFGKPVCEVIKNEWSSRG